MFSPLPPDSCRVYTPDDLASAMVGALGDQSRSRWLEPSAGEGAFLRALAAIGVDRDRVLAFDIDTEQSESDRFAKVRRGQDFLAWSLECGERFDLIVGNPPYAKLSKIAPELLTTARRFLNPEGVALTSGSNYWCAFVAACVSVLEPGGSLALVLPAAWDYADYAASFRESLPRMFSRFEIHRTRRPIFDSVKEGSVVIIGREFGQAGSSIRQLVHESSKELIQALKEAALPSSSCVRSPIQKSSRGLADSLRTWGEVFKVSIGGVTGDASYFLLSEAERKRRSLPLTSLKPVLTRARHLSWPEITLDEWRFLRDQGERVWLFSPTPGVLDHPAVRAYLNLSRAAGGCRLDRLKVRNRSPWYRTPLPGRTDGFLSGMSRVGPWVCLRKMAGLTATNTLYTVRFLGKTTLEERAAWSLSVLASPTRSAMAELGRVYPDGLLKFEPGDLMQLPIAVPPTTVGAIEHYRNAVGTLLSGDFESSKRIADQWLKSEPSTRAPHHSREPSQAVLSDHVIRSTRLPSLSA